MAQMTLIITFLFALVMIATPINNHRQAA